MHYNHHQLRQKRYAFIQYIVFVIQYLILILIEAGVIQRVQKNFLKIQKCGRSFKKNLVLVYEVQKTRASTYVLVLLSKCQHLFFASDEVRLGSFEKPSVSLYLYDVFKNIYALEFHYPINYSLKKLPKHQSFL